MPTADRARGREGGVGVSEKDRADALEVLDRLGIQVRPKAMPRAKLVTPFEADRQKALAMVLEEVQASLERCLALENEKVQA